MKSKNKIKSQRQIMCGLNFYESDGKRVLSKILGDFFKCLWSSQNMWTLSIHKTHMQFGTL